MAATLPVSGTTHQRRGKNSTRNGDVAGRLQTKLDVEAILRRMSNSQPIRLGVVGTGYVGPDHRRLLRSPRTSRRVRRHRRAQGRPAERRPDPDRRGRSRSRSSTTPGPPAGSSSCSAPKRPPADADIVFLCVPTPQGDDGSADLSYIEQAARRDRADPQARRGRGQQVDRAGRLDARGRARCSSATTCRSSPTPSSCARARRCSDFLHARPGRDRRRRPVGGREGRRRCTPTIDTADHHHRPGVGRDDQVRGQRFPGDEDLASSTPSRRCAKHVGADVAAVVDGIGSDTRIGRRFLNPGPGLGWLLLPEGLAERS